MHDIGWCTPILELMSHESHWSVDVLEEGLVACTEVIQPLLSLRRLSKPVLGALSMASEQDFAFAAIVGQSFELGLAKLSLLPGGGNQCHMLLFYLAGLRRAEREDPTVHGEDESGALCPNTKNHKSDKGTNDLITCTAQ